MNPWREITDESLAVWRTRARALLLERVPPEKAVWADGGGQADLFLADPGPVAKIADNGSTPFHVPRAFFEIAELVSFHRDPDKWNLLYRVLWRLIHESRDLLQVVVDDDVDRLLKMAKRVKRESHKLKAFVRFRKVESPEAFVAWHVSEHPVLAHVAPFFQRRFASQRWSILTPDLCAHWDLETLRYSPGVTQIESFAGLSAEGPLLEDLWRTYYASIFNPARIKIAAMKSEMPVRYWKNLPEAKLIPGLLREGSGRMQRCFDDEKKSAKEFKMKDESLTDLKKSASGCEACPLYEHATQTVFGEGPEDARVALVGEQPGDQEDLAGRPFVGPAGKVLDRALNEAGLVRDQLYLTNAVKHFKWKPMGKRRLHQKPRASEIGACHPWLEAEMAKVAPEIVVCLGATAAQSVFGKIVHIGKERGKFTRTAFCEHTLITIHPSAILRQPSPEAREEAYAGLVADLKLVADKIGGKRKRAEKSSE